MLPSICATPMVRMTPVLANEVDDAPATIALLDMCERERRHLGAMQFAAEEHSKNGAVTHTPWSGCIRAVQQRLRMRFECELLCVPG